MGSRLGGGGRSCWGDPSSAGKNAAFGMTPEIWDDAGIFVMTPKIDRGHRPTKVAAAADPSLDGRRGSAQNRISGRGASFRGDHPGIRIHFVRGCVSVYSASHGVYSSGGSASFLRARGPRRQILVPLALLAASDVILTTMVYRYPFSWDHFVTWAWYAGMLWLGTVLSKTLERCGFWDLRCGFGFIFLLSNLAVWAAWICIRELPAAC